MPYPISTPAWTNPIPAENALPGDAGWNNLTGQDQTHLAAYAGKVNIVAGDLLPIYVASDKADCTADIYRLGWYGGLGGRKLATVQFNTTNDLATGALNAAYSLGGTAGVPINMWTTDYDVGFYLQTLSNWVSGLYVARIYQTVGSRYPTWVPFTVSQPASQATYLCWLNDTTWQAYNVFGGYSIYAATAGNFSARVSYDRPWNLSASGNQDFSTWNLPFVRWIERQGYDVTYCGASELDLDPLLARRHPVFITPGHNEYVTKRIFNNIRAARDHGTSLGFFCANTFFKRIRWLPSTKGTGQMRTFECYEHFPFADPKPRAGESATRSEWAGDYPNTLVGVGYGSLCTGSPNVYPFVCADGAHWAFAGVNISTGESIPHLMGYEIDCLQPTSFTTPPPSPAGIQTIGSSPVTTSDPDTTAHTTFYTHPSGAGVFGAGTVSWAWGLDNYRAPYNTVQDYTDARLQGITTNVLRRLAAQGKTSAV